MQPVKKRQSGIGHIQIAQQTTIYIFLALYLLMTYRVCRLLLGFVGPSISVIIINKERVLYGRMGGWRDGWKHAWVCWYMDGLKGGSMGGWVDGYGWPAYGWVEGREGGRLGGHING